jgi:hypothetical protein
MSWQEKNNESQSHDLEKSVKTARKKLRLGPRRKRLFGVGRRDRR